jgi:hypothetical protein
MKIYISLAIIWGVIIHSQYLDAALPTCDNRCQGKEYFNVGNRVCWFYDNTVCHNCHDVYACEQFFAVTQPYCKTVGTTNLNVYEHVSCRKVCECNKSICESESFSTGDADAVIATNRTVCSSTL